jgi:hypothetical protein
MKKLVFIAFLLCFTIGVANIYAQDSTKVKETDKQDQKQRHHGGKGFIDLDGDGFNDNAPDHDGDGIPNGLDPDYQGPGKRHKFVDLDGDGIDDNLMSPMNDQQGQETGIGPQGGNMNGQTEEGTPQQKAGKGKRKRGNGNN